MSEFDISPLETGNGIKIVGELDVATAARLGEALGDAATQPELVLDLSGVTFLDSFGVHSILELCRARNGNGPVVIRNPSRAVTRVFEILALDMYPGLELQVASEPLA
jgi:anti-anti-sigma factor